jgi:hypothetical protein
MRLHQPPGSRAQHDFPDYCHCCGPYFGRFSLSAICSGMTSTFVNENGCRSRSFWGSPLRVRAGALGHSADGGLDGYLSTRTPAAGRRSASSCLSASGSGLSVWLLICFLNVSFGCEYPSVSGFSSLFHIRLHLFLYLPLDSLVLIWVFICFSLSIYFSISVYIYFCISNRYCHRLSLFG